MPLDLAVRTYRALGYVATPVVHAILSRRTRLGKEDPLRRHERFGRSNDIRPAGRLTWVHAASVGEMNASLDVIKRLTDTGETVLVTTGTMTSANLAKSSLPQGALHAYAPVDITPAIERFLDHWRPDRALFVESEIWPCMLTSLKRRQVPVFLINGRISIKSSVGWRRAPAFASTVFQCFDKVLAVSSADAVRFAGLGAQPVALSGNLKFDRKPPAADPKTLETLQHNLARRPVVTAISTHMGEEDVVLEAYATLRRSQPTLALFLVPRHPERAADVVQLVKAAGYSVKLRSADQVLAQNADVMVVDTLGEVGLVLRLADFAFIGGSLVPRGGQNPIEAASLGRFVLHGPETNNFRDVYRKLDDGGGARLIQSAHELSQALQSCMADPEQTRAGGDCGRRIVEKSRGALARTLRAIGSN